MDEDSVIGLTVDVWVVWWKSKGLKEDQGVEASTRLSLRSMALITDLTFVYRPTTPDFKCLFWVSQEMWFCFDQQLLSSFLIMSMSV